MTDHQEPDPLERLAAADPANMLPERHDAVRLREEIIMTSPDSHTANSDDRDRRRRATHRRPHRRVLVGALAVAAVTAVTAITVNGGADKQSDLPLIAADPTGAAGAPNVGAAGGVAEMSGADAKMAAPWYGGTEFTVVGEFDTLDSPAAAWILRSDATPSTEDLERLRRALDVDDEFAKRVEGEGEPWAWVYWGAGPDDGSGPGITVNGDALLSWWYTAGWAIPTTSVGCAVSEPVMTEPDRNGEGASGADSSELEDGTVTVEPMPVPCGDPMPLPVNLPDETETRALFAELLDALGVDPDDAIVETYLSEWGSSITGWLRLDGVRSPLAVSASYGADGQLESASGTLARPEKLGDYPRIGTTAGLAALTENYSWYGPATDAPMPRDGAVTDESNGGAIAAGEDAGRETPSAEPGLEPGAVVSEPHPPIEDPTTGAPPVTIVEIVDVEADLYMLWGNDNAIYLLPGYSFLARPDDYGYTPRYSVIAIGDEYFATTNSSTGGGAGSTQEDGGDVVITVITDEKADTLIGLSEEKAVAVGLENGWSVRVTSRDGEEYAVTMDYRTDRINLHIEDDTVTDVTVG